MKILVGATSCGFNGISVLETTEVLQNKCLHFSIDSECNSARNKEYSQCNYSGWRHVNTIVNI